MPIATSSPWGTHGTRALQGEWVASGIWTAVSGASAKAQAVDTIANNLANVDTVGFKKDHLRFQEFLAKEERGDLDTTVPRGPIQDKDFYPLDGRDQAFVAVTGSYSDHRPGSLKVTNAPLDVALDGAGLMEVSTPEGVRYTRQGSLKLATDGRLVTSQGYPVLASAPGGLASAPPTSAIQPDQGRSIATQGRVAAGGPPDPSIAARFIQLGDAKGLLSITPSGEIFEGENQLGKISVVEFNDTRQLRKEANLLFSNPDPANRIQGAPRTVVRQGMLEGSNVNPVEEMTNLIKMNRMFEQDLKAMKTYSEMMEKQNELGKL